MNRVANSRHQLSTLLKQAYENREALEEQIAQGKRNRKEAGNKYGKDINSFFIFLSLNTQYERFLSVCKDKWDHFMR